MTDRRRNFFILLVVAGLLLGSLAVIATKPTRLGLDLKGGVELVYQAKPTQQEAVDSDAIGRSIDIMRERVDQLGVAEPEIQKLGNEQIQVSLPDVKNQEKAQEQVGTTAQMYFYDWEPNVIGPDGKPDPLNPQVTGGQSAGAPPAALSHYDAVLRAAKREKIERPNTTAGDRVYVVNEKTKQVVAGPEENRNDLFDEPRELTPDEKLVTVPEGTILVRAESPDDASSEIDRWFVLNDDPVLRGTDIKNPEQNFDQTSNEPNVTFEFSDSGRDKWEEATRRIAERGQETVGLAGGGNQHFAIVLDDELISTPFIDFRRNPDGIDAANGSQIEGGFTISSAQELANLLKTGALPVRLELISSSQVSATLGQQALDQGLAAGIAGFAIVALFLLIFYRVLGLIAVAAMAIYATYFFALIKLIPVTMTLPGIAGLILTLGVAADANIVIFERVKEEIRAGRSISAGLAAGYKKGLAAIIDANVVTFMVAFILFILATAGVKGFAFMLGIGTLVSLFTAVLATSAIIGTLGRTRLMASRSALGAGEKRRSLRLNFMGASKWFFSASGLILLICAVALGANGLNFGIDFESGTRITSTLEQATDEQAVRDTLQSAGIDNPEVQKVTGEDRPPNTFQVSTEQLEPNEVSEVTRALDGEFGVQGEPDSQSVGPTFGETVARSAIIAIIASLIVVSVYLALRFEWKYAVPVLIALCHDLLITGGVYALVGREVTASTVAALLTILGFSLYDTIIVFDRIRENVPRMPRAAFSQIVNRSLSEVLVRSLATSFCTALPVFALLMFGGDTLKDFAFALLIGTISGTYSSVFIAGPVLNHWKETEPAYRKRAQRILDNLGYIPAYATSIDGKPIDVGPAERAERKRRSVLTSDEAEAVSAQEFEEMVRDISHEAPAARSATKVRPADQDEADAEPEPSPSPGNGGDAERARDLSPDELYLKNEGESAKRKRPRNKKHGRR